MIFEKKMQNLNIKQPYSFSSKINDLPFFFYNESKSNRMEIKWEIFNLISRSRDKPDT
jgi:hypothetical protein